VLAEGAVVGRIFKVNAAPVGTPWMWTLAFGHHEDRTPTHGYSDDALTLEATREIVQAELDLAQVRRVKVALIERARAFGTAHRLRGSVGSVDDVLNATVGSGSALSEFIASAPMMLSPAPERSAQATPRATSTGQARPV
jgi:hypothetical protein